jgi:hypothetical protein
MDFEIVPRGQVVTRRVFIELALPEAPGMRRLRQFFGDAHASWCTTRMIGDAAMMQMGMSTPRSPRRIADERYHLQRRFLVAEVDDEQKRRDRQD